MRGIPDDLKVTVAGDHFWERTRVKYRFKTTPYHHQVAALKKMRELNFTGALLMEPRTGKTKVAIDSAAILHQAGKVNRVLVLCPLSTIGVWQNEIAAHCPFPYKIVVWDKDGRRTTSLPPWSVTKLVFVLVNHDGLSTPGARLASGGRSSKRGGRWQLRRDLLRWQPQMIVVDESHRFKRTTASKSRMLYTIHAPYQMILTGTPVTKKKRIFDLYGQWQWLNPESPMMKLYNEDTRKFEKMTLGEFKKLYGVWTERHGYPQWLRNNPTQIKILHKYLHAESFAVKRDECFDLPPRTNQIIPVTLTGHTAEVYEQMAEEMIAKLKNGEITEASIKLVQSLRLGQLTSGLAKTVPSPQYPEGRLVRIGRDKLLVLEDLMTDWFEADEKVVVGSRWRGDIASIAALGRKLRVPVFELHGGIPARDRHPQHIEPFKRHDGAALFIMQPTAGALGIDLSAASIFVWSSLPGGDWVNFTQGEDRVALSKKSTSFNYLIADRTVDEAMYDSLMEDGDVARVITESPDRLHRDFRKPWKPKERGIKSRTR